MKRKILCGLFAAVLCFGMAVPVCAAEESGYTIAKYVAPAEGTTPDSNGAYSPGDKVTYTIEVTAEAFAMLYDPEVTDTLDPNLQVDLEDVKVESETLESISTTLIDGELSVKLEQSDKELRELKPSMSDGDTARIIFDAVIKESTQADEITNTAVLHGYEDYSLSSNEVKINVVVPPAPEPEPEPELLLNLYQILR